MLEPIKLKFYNEFIYTQLEEHLPNERDEKITAQVIENVVLPLNIAKDADIKDVGSGYGYFQIEMRKHGYNNICSLDYNLNTIRGLQQRELNFDRRDISFLPNKDESVDFIFARQCIQHSVFPFFTLMEYNRILKQKAPLYIEVPCPQQPAKHEMTKGVYSILTLEMWAALFFKSGFDLEINQIMTLEYNRKDTDEKIQDQHYAFLLRKKRPMDIK
jgi:SAM-dependent methyltransferase